MQGQPVWLCSVSRRNRDGRLMNTKQWANEWQEVYATLMHKALKGVGDLNRERLFRMNITLCLHRAATVEEVAGLPQTWRSDLSGMAGGPVEVLWSHGVPCPPSCLPCENPGRIIPEYSRPDLWVPQDCMKCVPCLARLAIENSGE